MPASLEQALDALESNPAARDWMGPVHHDAYLMHKRGEAAAMSAGTIVALLPDGGWKYLSAGTFSTNLDEMEEALEGGVNWW